MKCQGVKEFYMVARWGQTLATGRLLYKDRILPFPKYIDPSPLLDKLTLRASSETVCGLMDSSSCINKCLGSISCLHFQVDMMYSSIRDTEYGINVRPVGIYVATVSRLITYKKGTKLPIALKFSVHNTVGLIIIVLDCNMNHHWGFDNFWYISRAILDKEIWTKLFPDTAKFGVDGRVAGCGGR